MAERIQAVLVGSETLLGREIRDIAATAAPDLQLRLIAADEEKPGTLTRQADEAAVIEPLEADSLSGAQIVFLAASAEASRKALELADQADADKRPILIDLSFAAEERPDARLRAPALEEEDAEAPEEGSAVRVIAHPAAIAVALFLRRLHMHDPVRRSVIQIFAPASEHGVAGVEELQNQTVSLLSFKSLPRAVFDTQLGFNLLARYGEEAPVSLEESELRIERHLATLLSLPGEGEGAPMPSLRLIQAPVFHGYSFSAWVQFESNPGLEAIESGLASGSIEVRGVEFEPPTNVGQAGQGGITVGAIAPDRNDPEACWFWLVADNLRVMAENAVAAARESR
ncbi:MAG TPA: Asd/ArgC dimerization domain-containing protein [Bryobacteraceae bacterium]|nr:Asd/ArgC dimerization domain-containing protein [Bryobacteraceae bacterium]